MLYAVACSRSQGGRKKNWDAKLFYPSIKLRYGKANEHGLIDVKVGCAAWQVIQAVCWEAGPSGSPKLTCCAEHCEA